MQGLLSAGFSTDAVSGALTGAQAVLDRATASVEVVWTGPDGGPQGGGRLTSAVVVDVIDSAEKELLLVGYAVHNAPSVVAALTAATERGVAVTLLLERTEDNPSYSAGPLAFADLPALRLHWPAELREPGASLHAKVLVADEATALIGSANITGAALTRNLECGLLLRGGDTPRAVRRHVRQLQAWGVLRTL